jgi:hypothetical protein
MVADQNGGKNILCLSDRQRSRGVFDEKVKDI